LAAIHFKHDRGARLARCGGLFALSRSGRAGRLEEVSLGGAKARFVRALEAAKAESETIVQEAAPAPPQLDPEKMRIAEVSPRSAVIAAYNDLERILVDIRAKLKLPPTSNLPSIVRALVDKSLLPESALAVFDGLRKARNEADHLRDNISLEEALSYIEQADRLRELFQKVRDRLN
jgi:Domain of unknown function (DUF4145)